MPSGCTIIVTSADREGVHSGRPQFRVYCATCAVEIHEATTEPGAHTESHINHQELWCPMCGRANLHGRFCDECERATTLTEDVNL